MNETKTVRRLWAAQRYLTFFLLMSFVVTCCMMLFLGTMQRTMGVEFTRENIGLAAKLTFGNVMLVSLLCTVIDRVRRWFMVDRPVRRIAQAAERMMAGDLSVRVKPFLSPDPKDGFNEVIRCFNRMAQELSGIETLRSDFIANVSHELKTPLAAIQNYGVMLQQPGLAPDQRLEYARGVTDTARRLADLVSNILKLNKLENQQIFPETQVFNLGEQLCRCVLDFEEAWEEKRLDLDAEIEEGVHVRSDPELLALVWNNLLSNAVKFTPEGGQIGVALKLQGDTAVVQVSDTGCGISPEVGKHIFEKFYQGDTSHTVQGNGLGLALAKRVVDIVGGGISVSSQVGQGSVFTVTIPGTGYEKGS